tara:strand:- start:1278 stop:1946 length:669 start_codon:yes stop_codon:yes gene_type:complete
MTEANPTANDKTGYQNRKLTFDDKTLRDENGRAIMMEWEKPIMEHQGKFICQNGGKILNVGFGMGYIDDEIQRHNVEKHTIIECHPDVWLKMREDGWMDKPNVECIFGTWQEIMPRLEAEGRMFDGVYFDTWDEEDIPFHMNIQRLLYPDGLYSWFNKTLNPKQTQMNGKYAPLTHWFDIECEKLDVLPPSQEEQANGGEGFYWNPDSTIYWHPKAIRKRWV